MRKHADKTERALFAAGCFWGVEYFFKGLKGVVATTVGYAGGVAQDPTNKEVCNGTTGHAEVVEVQFNPNEISFEALVKCFFEMHNPALIANTSGKRSQYRSAIFYCSKEQRAVAESLIEQLRIKAVEVSTELAPASAFFKAEDYHQDYYTKRGKTQTARHRKPKF